MVMSMVITPGWSRRGGRGGSAHCAPPARPGLAAFWSPETTAHPLNNCSNPPSSVMRCSPRPKLAPSA